MNNNNCAPKKYRYVEFGTRQCCIMVRVADKWIWIWMRSTNQPIRSEETVGWCSDIAQISNSVWSGCVVAKDQKIAVAKAKNRCRRLCERKSDIAKWKKSRSQSKIAVAELCESTIKHGDRTNSEKTETKIGRKSHKVEAGRINLS